MWLFQKIYCAGASLKFLNMSKCLTFPVQLHFVRQRTDFSPLHNILKFIQIIHHSPEYFRMA